MSNKKRELLHSGILNQFVDTPEMLMRVIYKISVEAIDALSSAYVIANLTRGANWTLHALSGYFETGTYRIGMQMVRRLINPDLQKQRNMIRAGWEALKKAKTVEETFTSISTAFDNLAFFFEDDEGLHPELNDGHPLWNGDFHARSGLPFMADGSLSAGTPGSPLQRADADARGHGIYFRFFAAIYRARAKAFRDAIPRFSTAEVEELKEKVLERLETAFRRAMCNPLLTNGRFYANLFRDSYNAKEFLIDVNRETWMRDFVRFDEVPIRTADGRILLLAVPTRVIRELKDTYRDITKVLCLASRDAMGEDLRYEYHPRRLQDIGNSRCAFAYIDDTALWEKYKDTGDLTHFPTAETMELPPPLLCEPMRDPETKSWEQMEFKDIVYAENGCRRRMYANGSTRNIVGEPPKGAPEILMLPGITGHAKKIPHPYGGFFEGELLPRTISTPPADRDSVSDGDQADYRASFFEATFQVAWHVLRMLYRRRWIEKAPFNNNIIESRHDVFLSEDIAISWMLLKVKLKGMEEPLDMALNINKENEKTLTKEFWQYINQNEPVRHRVINGQDFLRLDFEQARKDAAREARCRSMLTSGSGICLVEENGRLFLQVPMPIEMLDFIDKVKEIWVDPVRFGKMEGPYPLASYRFQRRTADNLVTDRKREKFITPNTCDQIFWVMKNCLHTQEDIDYMRRLGDNVSDIPYVDEDDIAHLKINSKEFNALETFMPPGWQGARARHDGKEALVPIMLLGALRKQVFNTVTYRRYVPDKKYPLHHEEDVLLDGN